MKQRSFGTTGLQVSEIGFGAWAIGGNRFGNSYGPTEDATSLSALAAALEAGCTFFDTADVYGHGHSEELLGKALAGHRKDVVIATKVGGDFYHGSPRTDFSDKYILFACEKSLERLKTDVIDVYQLHNPPLSLIERGDIFEPLEKLKSQGKIRFYGISIHDPREGLAAMKAGKPSSIQVVYNLLKQDPAEDLFPEAKKRGVAIIAREPLHNGFLTGKYNRESRFPSGDIRCGWPQDYLDDILDSVARMKGMLKNGQTLPRAALKFCLEEEAVSVVIPGCKTVQQVEENMSCH